MLDSSLDLVPMASHGTLLHFPLLLLIQGPPKLATVCLEDPIVSPNMLRTGSLRDPVSN